MTVHRLSGRPAHTSYRTLEVLKGFSLLEVKIQTGRTHQIRVHLAGQNMPILGDILYGNAAADKAKDSIVIPRLMLHAFSLTVAHPISEQVLTWQSPLPNDFKTCLSAYQKLVER